MDAAYFLRVQTLTFRMMGFDLWESGSKNDRPQITFVVMILSIAFLAPLLFSTVINVTIVSIMSDALGSVLAIVVSVVKYLVFVYHRKSFVHLIYRIRDILEKEMRALPEIIPIVEMENRNDQSLSLTYMRCFFAACVFAGVKPVIIMLTLRLRTGHTHLELPHAGVYPWSDQALLPYVPTYLWNLMASYGAVTMSLAMDTLLFAFTYNVCALFKIAQYRVRHLQPISDAPRRELDELVRVLQLHQTGLDIGTQLGHSLRPLVFIQFLVSAVQLCFVGFQLADLFPTLECIYFIFFLGSIVIALFIYSHCGENMRQASVDFGTALYDSSWVDFAPATRQALIVAIMRAQLPCQLNGYFFEPNMANFSAVVRSAISYVMMLRSFNG
ncbi:odorant receptor 9a [Drosophila mojavensis]|uniref:Odorant receptor n=1 Tax=Drosophila mojavensis TaxID=7230 RepID=B4L282_DROMO|nr:odorant receptor 9a [Drosophila mojavensis]EDW06822.1 uncharacterized protein Dmoj_GI15391 [Drosophila mojavensis]